MIASNVSSHQFLGSSSRPRTEHKDMIADNTWASQGAKSAPEKQDMR